MFARCIYTILTTERFIVGTKNTLIDSGCIDANTIISETFCWMQIEHEQKTGSFKNDNFVTFMFQADKRLNKNYSTSIIQSSINQSFCA